MFNISVAINRGSRCGFVGALEGDGGVRVSYVSCNSADWDGKRRGWKFFLLIQGWYMRGHSLVINRCIPDTLEQPYHVEVEGHALTA